MPPAPASLEKLQSSLRHWRDRAEAAKFSGATNAYVLVALVAIYLAVTSVVAASRLLWHDELFTFYIATASSWSKLWKEIPLDLNPPLEFVLVRLSTSIFGFGNYAIRLPSIIGFLAGSLCLYAFVVRRLSTAYGVLAICVFWASPFFYYATEARPYALVTGFLGLTLVAWERATRSKRRWTAVMMLALTVTGMMLSHLLSLFYVVPFCLAELARVWKTRRIDFSVWAALLLPCFIPFVYLRLMARFGQSVFPGTFQASLRRVPEIYYGTLKLEALPLLIGLGLAILVVPEVRPLTRQLGAAMNNVLFSLTVGFLLVPLIVNLALMRSHGAYFDRYALPVEFGYAVVVAFTLSRLTGQARLPAWTCCAVLLLFMLAYNLGPGLKQSVWNHRTAQNETSELESIRPQLPLVAASGLTFVEMDHYGAPAVVDRLYYLTDHDRAIRYAHATIFEGMQDLKGSFPIRAHVQTYSDFISQHPTFLVLGTPEYPEDWLLKALLDEHATVQYLGDVGGPYKDHQLYLASIPER